METLVKMTIFTIGESQMETKRTCSFRPQMLMYLGIMLMFNVQPARFDSQPSVCPTDTVVVVGETVRLRCIIYPDDDTARWFRGNDSKPDAYCLHSGQSFFEYNVDMNRFSIQQDGSIGSSELIIKNARPEDVGVYMCTGLPSNARAIVKLNVIEQLVNESSSLNLSSNVAIKTCSFKYFGPIKPTAEWLDADGNIIGNSSESTDTEGLVVTSTNASSAVKCRLSFQRSSCGNPVTPIHFGQNDGNKSLSTISRPGTSRTLIWAWTATILTCIFISTTLIMMWRAERRRVTHGLLV